MYYLRIDAEKPRPMPGSNFILEWETPIQSAFHYPEIKDTGSRTHQDFAKRLERAVRLRLCRAVLYRRFVIARHRSFERVFEPMSRSRTQFCDTAIQSGGIRPHSKRFARIERREAFGVRPYSGAFCFVTDAVRQGVLRERRGYELADCKSALRPRPNGVRFRGEPSFSNLNILFPLCSSFPFRSNFNMLPD